jgi:hypothetical protein
MLLGSIKQGTISKLFKALTQANADGMLLLESGGQRAQIVFEKGTFKKANAAGLSGEDALIAVKRWSDGHYALKKESEDQPLVSQGHVFLALEDSAKQKKLNEWLLQGGFETSMIPYLGELIDLAAFLKPDAVVIDCPPSDGAANCHELLQQLTTLKDPPALIGVPPGEPDDECVLDPSQLLHPFEQQRLQQILAEQMEVTSSSAAFQEIVSAEMQKPTTKEVAIAMKPTVLDVTSAEHGPTDVTAKTMALDSASSSASGARKSAFPPAALAVLAMGSAAIWVAYFLLRG